MSKYFDDVEKFLKKFDLLPKPFIQTLPDDLHQFRHQFLIEELTEFKDSTRDKDLATAIDSLIDLIYIACGTLALHGISSAQFEQYFQARLDINGQIKAAMDLASSPVFINDIDSDAIKNIETLIAAYATEHERCKMFPYLMSYIPILFDICLCCLDLAREMKVSQACWDEMWDDVQRANMEKIRVLRSEDSKRGSTYDVCKPDGWVPPRSQQILEKYLAK